MGGVRTHGRAATASLAPPTLTVQRGVLVGQSHPATTRSSAVRPRHAKAQLAARRRSCALERWRLARLSPLRAKSGAGRVQRRQRAPSTFQTTRRGQFGTTAPATAPPAVAALHLTAASFRPRLRYLLRPRSRPRNRPPRRTQVTSAPPPARIQSAAATSLERLGAIALCTATTALTAMGRATGAWRALRRPLHHLR